MAIGLRIKKGNLHGGFELIGRNEATTFRGLCSKHDTALFERIDKGPLDPADPEVSFLLGWRAVTQELHENISAASRLQSAYSAKVENGELSGDVPSPLGNEATSWIITAYATHLYREERWNPVFADKNYARLRFKTFKLTRVEPVIAASGMFSIDEANRLGDRVRMTLNVWPDSEGDTIVQFGFARRDTGQAAKFIRSLTHKRDELCAEKFSTAILNHLQNFVISPNAYEAWSDEKRGAIEKAFVGDGFGGGRVEAEPILNLFEVT
ncbi:hypothetical protein [Hyphococcus sp.]|uniref:hypothetical protein n=1 Tax=Hyphococcus sp. TaxID=2038636 RepID=UPI0035C77051